MAGWLERESIQMRVMDSFYSRCAKGYYMRGRAAYGFDLAPIVMDGIKTKKLVEAVRSRNLELARELLMEDINCMKDEIM